MRKVTVQRPSFPISAFNQLLKSKESERWQVICGDEGYWRAGTYSPPEVCAEDCLEIERHDCPELFVLLSGRLSLVLIEDGLLRRIELESGRPILVTAPHSGFCPDGPHTGVAMVIERDALSTEYRTREEWLSMTLK